MKLAEAYDICDGMSTIIRHGTNKAIPSFYYLGGIDGKANSKTRR
jgi:hypothetical protein